MSKRPHDNQGEPDRGYIDLDLSQGLDEDEIKAIEEGFESGGSNVTIPQGELSDDELSELLTSLQRERDEAVAARQRALADYANFQKRSAENEQRARKDGQVAVVHALLPVLDHFELALKQDTGKVTAEQILGGVKIVQDELFKALEAFGVKRIVPRIGDAFDPQRHEAMMRQPAEGVEPNHITAVYQPGFASGERVIRPAKVSVAPED